MKSAQSSTQKFTELLDIVGNVAILTGGNACLVIEVQASNFALLSREEQDAKIYAYASFLNSLSVPAQIVIRNKKIDISSYVNVLNQLSSGNNPLHAQLSEAQNKALVEYIKLYRDFITELIKVNTVLDKSFYLVLSYSYLEAGITNATKNKMDAEFVQGATASLKTKADGALSQLSRLSLRAKVLEKEELVRLFYDIYNPNNPVSGPVSDGLKAEVITTQKKA